MKLISDRPLRVGVLGAARIARRFVDGARGLGNRMSVQAVASRSLDKAQAFAREFSIPQAHGSYEALLADPGIDAVYNPLPNNLHAEWSIKAAEAGKHVICEKPLAMTSAEAVAMFDAAGRHDVFLVEAYPYRAQPQTKKLAELLAARAIGNIQVVQATFGFPLTDPANIRLIPEMGGGAHMDAGSYPVSLVRMVAGASPVRVHALARWDPSGVDRTLAGTIEFANGVLGQIACSFSTARNRRALIIGDDGIIDTTYMNDTSADFPPVVEVRRGNGWDAKYEKLTLAMTDGFRAEIEAFCDLVAGGWDRWPGAMPEESVDIMRILEALAKSARGGGAVAL
jgi:predicted dehydrogenase